MCRQIFADYIVSMIRRLKIAEAPSDNFAKTQALPTMAKLAYCKDEWDLDMPLSEKSRNMFRGRLTSAFTHLISDPSGLSYPCDLLDSFTPDAVDMDERIAAAKDAALATMQKLMKKTKKAKEADKATFQSLALLYALVIYQLYNGEADAVSVLDELKLCYDKMIRGKDSADDDVEASEVLIEVLLSFISKPSMLLRRVAEHVFTAFSEQVTAGGLKLMTDVLESSESLRGQQELFDQEADDDDLDMDEDDEEDGEELDSDVEIVDVGDADADADSNEDDDAEADGADSEEPEDDEEGRKLDAALAAALGTHRLDQDDKAEDSDSDADMTDSEMMALDSKLVEIFAARKKQPNKKQEKKDAKETMVNFKNRVLDLLEIYVKKQTANPAALELLLPLLQCIRTTATKQVGEKAQRVIIAFATAASKGGAKAAGSTEHAHDEKAHIKLLKAIHVEAARDASHAYTKACSTASLLVVRKLVQADKGSVKKIATVYRDTQVAWVEGEVKLHASFFVDWVNWCQSRAAV